jgi:hypothetical protein
MTLVFALPPRNEAKKLRLKSATRLTPSEPHVEGAHTAQRRGTTIGCANRWPLYEIKFINSTQLIHIVKQNVAYRYFIFKGNEKQFGC